MSYHSEFQKKLDGIIGKKKKTLSASEWHNKFLAGKHRVLIKYICDLYECPSTITGKVLHASNEDALLAKAQKIYGEKVVVKIISQEVIYDSDKN